MEIVFSECRKQMVVWSETYIGDIKYKMTFEDHGKIWYITLASGKKRKELSIFEQKEQKSRNGYEVVKWCIACIEEFPYKGKIAVTWSDARRRKIYERFLTKIGFKLTRIDKKLCFLMEYK